MLKWISIIDVVVYSTRLSNKSQTYQNGRATIPEKTDDSVQAPSCAACLEYQYRDASMTGQGCTAKKLVHKSCRVCWQSVHERLPAYLRCRSRHGKLLRCDTPWDSIHASWIGQSRLGAIYLQASSYVWGTLLACRIDVRRSYISVSVTRIFSRVFWETWVELISGYVWEFLAHHRTYV